MRYALYYRFWGTTKLERIVVDNASIRNKLVNRLENDYAITYISINKLYASGLEKPYKSYVIH